MIASFACKETQKIFNREFSKKFPVEIQARAYQKMMYLNGATSLQDLRSVPSFHLEKLSGDRKGQHSIMVNKQWRVCFTWVGGSATGVEIVDYH